MVIELADKAKLLSEIARRRGFFWPSFEIYGGVSGFLDLGPLGVGLKSLVTESWRDFFLRRHGFLEISTPIITPHKVLEASGHVDNFKDPMTECTQCKRRFRADQIVKEQISMETEGLSLEQLGDQISSKEVRCPECGGKLGAPQYFMTMFQTSIGAFSEEAAYGRPEAAQGIFANFRRISEVTRERFPIGIAQVGTVLRNEISPRQGPIRLREFTIMDFELFFNPENPNCPYLDETRDDYLSMVTARTREHGKDERTKIRVVDAVRNGVVKAPWMAYFMALSQKFLVGLGIPENNQRFFEKLPGEKAHYSSQTFDQEIQLDRYGWVEVAGFAYRTDYDLQQHMKATGVEMGVFQPYEKPTQRTSIVVRPRPARVREVFGSDAGNVLAALAGKDLAALVKTARKGMVRVEHFDVPIDCFEHREETVKETGTRFVPHVVEPSFGVERLVYAVLEYALRMQEDRVVLGLPPALAPVQLSVFPLVNKDGLQEAATSLYETLVKRGFRAEYDEAGSIGRRYARADEAGVPIGLTVDYETLTDRTVTLRDRDTWTQVRVPVDSLKDTIDNMLRTGFPKRSS